MDRGAWWATVHGVPKESEMIYQLNYKTLICSSYYWNNVIEMSITIIYYIINKYLFILINMYYLFYLY